MGDFSVICPLGGRRCVLDTFWILLDTPKTATFFWIPGRVILDTIGMHICICSICICYSHSSCSKSSAHHSAFASARLLALRRLQPGKKSVGQKHLLFSSANVMMRVLPFQPSQKYGTERWETLLLQRIQSSPDIPYM